MGIVLVITNLGYEPGAPCCSRALPPEPDATAADCPDLAFITADGRLSWQLGEGTLFQPPLCLYRELRAGPPAASAPAWATDEVRYAFAAWSHEPTTTAGRLFLATLAEPRVGLWRWRLCCLHGEDGGWRAGAERDFGFRFQVGQISQDEAEVLLLGGPHLLALGLPGLETRRAPPAPPGYHASAAHYSADGRWILGTFGAERKRSKLVLIDAHADMAAELGEVRSGEWTAEADLAPEVDVVVPLPIYQGRVRLRVRGPAS